MLKTKRGLASKPSKSSLISRGLPPECSRPVRRGSKTSMLDGCYSLYSTDSEDNVAGVSKGLDKCAKLLTNILEINGEKETQKSLHHASKHWQSVVSRNKKQKLDPSSKPASIKEKGDQKPKRKSRTSIHVPTVSTQTTPSKSQLSKSKPRYNERVAASTPLLTTDQRKRQQELQHRERVLEEQIHLLQAQYENLQKQNTGQSEQASPSQLEMGTLHQLLNTSQEHIADKNSSSLDTRSVRKSLDFRSNAEKPFIDNLKEHESFGTVTDSTSSNIQNEGNLEGEMKKNTTTRKVQFEKQSQCRAQETKGSTPGTSPLNSTEAEGDHSPPTTSILHEKGSTGLSLDVEEEQRGKKCNQSKTGSVSKHQSPSRNSDHFRILTYLVGELKAVLATSEDVEVERLLMEIENEFRLLSFSPQRSGTSPVSGGTTKQHDVDTEVALQPLRSENSDLRRKLRIANQRLREMESQRRQVSEKDRTYNANEDLIENLHHQLLVEKESVGKLRHEKEQVEKTFADYEKDKLSLQHLLAEKEKKVKTLIEQLKRQKSKVMAVDSQAKLQLESLQITLCAKNKEVELLNLALQQRDAEIERLTELTRGLQQSLTRVLTNVQNLHLDDIVSEVSTAPSFVDSWQTEQRATKSSVRLMAPGNCVNQLETWDNFDDRKEALRDEFARDYRKKKAEGPGNKNVQQQRGSPEEESADDVSLSLSSADEFVFKQELANLDTVIARLQDSLRSKV